MRVQDWSEITDHTALKLGRISGAMTNFIYLVSGPSREGEALPRKVLLRVYGIGLESLFSRENELHWLQNLSTMDIGPSLLGIFKNGRFEQYVESTTLTKEDIRDPTTSRHIAHRMCELHNIVNVFPPPEGTIPQSQANIAKWIPLAKAAIGKIIAKDPSKKADLEELDFDKLLVEIDEVHRELLSVHSPLVFSHNDVSGLHQLSNADRKCYDGYTSDSLDPLLFPSIQTQYGNILRTTDEDGELVVIDFEYAGYNTRAFDIANHFCEWTADYHSERPSIMHHDRYPTKAEQLNFLQAYMEAEIAMAGYHLTAINMEKYAKTSRRRSISQALTNGLAQVAAAASTALKQRPSTEFLKEEQAVAANVENAEDSDGNGSTKASAAISAGEREHDRVIPRKKSNGSDGSGGVTKVEILDSMYKEVNKFALTSHIMWGLWGLHQATQSDIDFDYVEYALQRLNEFRRRRPEFMSL